MRLYSQWLTSWRDLQAAVTRQQSELIVAKFKVHVAGLKKDKENVA